MLRDLNKWRLRLSTFRFFVSTRFLSLFPFGFAFLAESVCSTHCTMETHEGVGSASPHGGRGTEAQSPSVPHRLRFVDGDRAPCTTDHQTERVSRQEPHDDAVDRTPCTTRPHEEPERRLEPQDEARASSGRRPCSRPLPCLLARRPRHLDASPPRSVCRA